MPSSDLRHITLTRRERVLAVQTLTHYLMSGTFGGEWALFAPSRDDVESYFPIYSVSCVHCRENKGNLDLVSISIEKVLKSNLDAAQQFEFLKMLKLLGGSSDIRIIWIAFFRCLELGWDESLVAAALWSFVKGVSVPITVAKYFKLDLESAILKTLDATEKYAEDRDHVAHRDLRIRQLYRDLIEGKIDQVLKDVFEDPDANFAIWKLLTPKVLETGSSATVFLWLRVRDEAGSLNSRDLTDLFESAILQDRRLSSDEAEIVITNLLSQENSFSLASAIRYAGAVLDIGFGLRVVAEVIIQPWWIQKIIIHEISMFLMQIEQEDQLLAIFDSEEVFSELDYRTYDYFTGIARFSEVNNASRIAKNCLVKIDTYALNNIESIDLGILFSLIANKSESLHESHKHSILGLVGIDTNQNVIRSSLVHPQLETTYCTAIYELVLYDPKFAKLLGNVSSALSQPIDEGFLLSNFLLQLEGNTDTLEVDFSNVTNIEFQSLYIGMVKQILGIDYSDSLGELTLVAIESLASKERYLNRFLLESILLKLATHSQEDIQKKLITRIFNVVPSHRVQNAYKTALINVAKSNTTINHGAMLREVGSNFGVRVDTTIAALIINNELLREDVFDVNTLQGPPSESWNQLAIILDDVVHELNQPIGALANWVGVVRELEHNSDLNREALSKAIVGMEKSLSYLGERMGTYRSLTSGGTENAWIDIEELCFGVADTLTDNFKVENISLRKTSSHLKSKWVYGNTFQLRLALRGLLMNGIQATLNSANPKEIEVNIYNPPRNLDAVLIQVRDSGPGIPTEIQSRIFDRGFTTKPGRGLGLGLSLTASVVTSMHGQVKLSSSGATGSEFVIRLPSFVLPRHGAPYDEIEILSVDFESELELIAYHDEFEIEGSINE